MRSASRLSLTCLFLAACGGNVVVDGSGGVTTSGGNGGTGGVTASGGNGGTGGVTTVTTATACLDAGAQAFLPAFKVCSAPSDCTIQNIYDCCADYAVGVAAAQVQTFDAYEQACVNLPKCGCAEPPVAEDGKMGNIQVECQNGLCMTYVP